MTPAPSASAPRSPSVDDIRLLKLAEMYERAFEAFVVEMARRYVEDDEVRRLLAPLWDPRDDHEGRIARELQRLNASLPEASKALVERAALLDILDVERAAREFYLAHLDKPHDPAVAHLFRELAHEEGAHARVAQAALALHDRRRGRVTMPHPPEEAGNGAPLWEGTAEFRLGPPFIPKGADGRKRPV